MMYSEAFGLGVFVWEAILSGSLTIGLVCKVDEGYLFVFPWSVYHPGFVVERKSPTLEGGLTYI